MTALDTPFDPAMAPPPGATRRRPAAGSGDNMMRGDTIHGGTTRGERATLRYHRVQLALGIIGIIAAAVLVIVGALNRSLQANIAAGQARIANAQAAANVNNTLIRLLAKAAAEKNDERIRTLLSQNGISFRPNTLDGTADPAATTPIQPR